MNRFLRDAESILEIAAAAPDGTGDTAIVMDRSGGMRMLDATGWSMAGLVHEFGAKEAYRIGRGLGSINVEGWSAGKHCLVTNKTSAETADYPRMLQMLPSPGV